MKGDVYYGKGIRELKDSHPDLFELVSNINDTVWDGKVLDYKTQKLIAIGITASRADPRATKKQMRSAIEVLGITKEEIVDVLRVVLLTSGMPAFSKSLQILNSVVEAIEEGREDKA
ncbi:MAG: carboxymuconolactone decarboxylase family protein [Methanobrevibacter sp.]|nr:carboxymuconolactone decarboxylase family protein [Methanobrevibacter sp.]